MSRKSLVSLEDFIQTWETSNSVNEVSEKLGLAVASVRQRVSKYRAAEFNPDGTIKRRAIPLKKMPRANGNGNAPRKINDGVAFELLAKLRNMSLSQVATEATILEETQKNKDIVD